jgi:glycerol-3-phosphate dehydrogenase
LLFLESKQMTRESTLDYYQHHPELPVLIIGGGINGVGLLRELALQNIDALLIDKSDFCSGASAASSRMIHGGLRYLEFGEFKLVQESIKERTLLLQNAPHYVQPLPTTITIFSRFSGLFSSIKRIFKFKDNFTNERGALMIKIGLMFYDMYTRRQSDLPKHRFFFRKKSLRRYPGLTQNIISTCTYYDALINYPERLGLELVLDAKTANAHSNALNYVSCENGNNSKITLKDELTGKSFEVKPNIVINATGAWIDFTNQKLSKETRFIGGTKGSHLVLDHPELHESLDGDMFLYENEDGRACVMVPWLGNVLIGSTDIKITDPDKVVCGDDEIDYMIKSAQAIFSGIDINKSQIISTFVGVRPLPFSDASETRIISRDHELQVTEADTEHDYPIISMVGGKWTTFRSFAEQTTDLILKKLNKYRKQDSDNIPIGGGKEFPKDKTAKKNWVNQLNIEPKFPENRLHNLLTRYGSRAVDFANYINDDKDNPIANCPKYSRREIEFIIKNEHIEHLDDLILRRTAIGLTEKPTYLLIEELATLMKTLKKWSAEKVKEEIERTLDILADHHRIYPRKK